MRVDERCVGERFRYGRCRCLFLLGCICVTTVLPWRFFCAVYGCRYITSMDFWLGMVHEHCVADFCLLFFPTNALSASGWFYCISCFPAKRHPSALPPKNHTTNRCVRESRLCVFHVLPVLKRFFRCHDLHLHLLYLTL